MEGAGAEPEHPAPGCWSLTVSISHVPSVLRELSISPQAARRLLSGFPRTPDLGADMAPNGISDVKGTFVTQE